jgi:hypothetical protein
VADLWARGDIAEFLAMGFLPWCVDGVLRMREAPTPRRALGLGVAAAAAILSHNILGMLAGGTMAATALVATATSPRPLRTGALAALGGAIGLLLTAFFWIPALLERQWVRTERMIQGFYAVESNFRPLANLFHVGEMPASELGMPVSLGLGGPAILLAAVAVLAPRRIPRQARPLALVGAVLLVGGGFLVTSASRPVWGVLPLLRFAQFPWRFAAIAALGAAIGAALGFEALGGRWRRALRVGAAAVVGAAALAGVRDGIAPGEGLPAIPGLLEIERIRSQRFNTTARNEYLPRWVPQVVEPLGFEEGVQVVGDAVVRDVVRRVGRYELRVQAGEPATLVLRDYYYPGWRATIDGRAAEVRPRAATGHLELDVPAGTRTVHVRFGPTPLRAAASALSAATALAAVVALVARRRTAGTGAGRLG